VLYICLFNDVISSEHTISYKMTSEKRVVKNVAEGGCSLTERVSWPLPGATQKNMKTSIRTSRLWTKI